MTSSRAAPLRRTADHSAFDSVSQPAAMSNDDRPMVMVVDLTLPDPTKMVWAVWSAGLRCCRSWRADLRTSYFDLK